MSTNEPVPAAPAAFNPAALIGGLFLSLGCGAVANVVAGLMGASTNSKVLAFFIGLVPGLLFVGLSRLPKSRGLAAGFLIGGCIIALVGGVCGAAITPLNFR